MGSIVYYRQLSLTSQGVSNFSLQRLPKLVDDMGAKAS